MNDKDQNPDGPVKVVDRRWWTKDQAGDAPTGDDRPRKPSYVEDLERQLGEKDKAIQAHAQRYRESAAEFEQVRARLRRDLDRDIDRARRAILADFLEVADNLDRALVAGTAASGPDDPVVRGVQIVRDLLLAKLAAYDVRPIPAEGQAFDARLHEAISVVAVDDPALEDTVVSVIKTGYAIRDEVLRPAAVAVGRSGN